jgi:hypothetical protein
MCWQVVGKALLDLLIGAGAGKAVQNWTPDPAQPEAPPPPAPPAQAPNLGVDDSLLPGSSLRKRRLGLKSLQITPTINNTSSPLTGLGIPKG